MNRRAQAAIEFLILLGFMVLVFTTFLVVVKERSAENRERALQNDLSTVAAIIQQEVTMAHRVRGGYYRTFELPASINDAEYNITLYPAIAPSEVVIRGGEFEYILFLPVNLSPYSNISPGANMISKNDQGNISIGPAGNCVHAVDCDDGKVCTNNACVHGSCTFADTCGKEQTCTEGGCECKTGTNDIMAAGEDGGKWNKGGAAIERVPYITPTANVCCAANECPWIDDKCYAIGTRVLNRFTLCEEADAAGQFEPTVYRCSQPDPAHDGWKMNVGGKSYCCAQLADGTGRWGFNTTAALSRGQLEYNQTGCTDGHDNDCDGLADCADPGCATICNPSCDLTAPTNLGVTVTGVSADLAWTPGSSGATGSVQQLYVGPDKNQVLNGCPVFFGSTCVVAENNLPSTQSAYLDIAVTSGLEYWVRVVNYRDDTCKEEPKVLFSFTVPSCAVGATCTPPTGGVYDASCACVCPKDTCLSGAACVAVGGLCAPPTGGTYDAACACACAANQCTINGVCYANGADNPGNECQYCDTTKTKIAWSNKADLTLCTDDGRFCTSNYCDAGVCAEHPYVCPFKGQRCNELLNRCEF